MSDNPELLSTDEAKAKRNEARQNRKKKGLIIVNTGDGKGKTTAALGILLRAWGRDMRIGGIQFVKHETASCGELKALKKWALN